MKLSDYKKAYKLREEWSSLEETIRKCKEAMGKCSPSSVSLEWGESLSDKRIHFYRRDKTEVPVKVFLQAMIAGAEKRLEDVKKSFEAIGEREDEG